MGLSLVKQLDAHGRQRPDTVAVREWGEPDQCTAMTWRQWGAAAAALAARWREQTSSGAAVLLATGNRLSYHVGFLAALLADRHPLPVSPEAGERELANLVTRGGVESAIAHPPAFDRLPPLPGPIFSSNDWPGIHSEDEQAGGDAAANDVERPANENGTVLTPAVDIAEAFAQCAGEAVLLLASSGSTGRPKLVRRPAPTLDAVARNCVSTIGFGPTDRVLIPMPAYHSYGMEHGLLSPLLAGCAVDLWPAFDASAVSRALADQPITLLPAVPFVYEALAETWPRLFDQPPALALHCAYSAGAPLPGAVAEAMERWLGMPVGQVYGSTEIGSVTFNDPRSADFDAASVGRPMSEVSVRVVDPEQRDPAAPLPAGETGEVAIRAPSMMSSYAAAVDENGEVEAPGDLDGLTRDGFFLTGDLGCVDVTGRLTLTGRRKLLIDVGGLKVNPAEVEAVLASHPAVHAAAIVPLPVTATVNRLKVVIVPASPGSPSINEQALRQFARDHLAPHKVPRQFEWRDTLPLNEIGKVRREALQSAEAE